ncbi:hypothetical protein EYF80_015412 [Liparis tanakae]|uniref:Uncharacterized protein n=1 Tax=Liparis tanakae TaxID=230148 RepID=A0A4Z2I8E9_9TELE|nr:hypothetical protein EYF80_015412 [Liparis tanakae]
MTGGVRRLPGVGVVPVPLSDSIGSDTEPAERALLLLEVRGSSSNRLKLVGSLSSPRKHEQQSIPRSKVLATNYSTSRVSVRPTEENGALTPANVFCLKLIIDSQMVLRAHACHQPLPPSSSLTEEGFKERLAEVRQGWA